MSESNTQLQPIQTQSLAIQSMEEGLAKIAPMLPAIAPRNLNIEKFLGLLQIEFYKTPDLDKCDPYDMIKVVTEVASLGLEPGNEVYLAVFHSKKQNKYILQKMVGFQGWYRILVQSPRIKKVITDVVCKGDDFYQDRMNDEYRHVVPQDAPRSTVTHAYCVVTLDNGEKLYRVLDRGDLDRHQRRARNSGEGTGWETDYPMMAMKSAMQDFAARHKGLINLIAREALEQVERDEQVEYENTGPSNAVYQENVSNIFGDPAPALARGREAVSQLIDAADDLAVIELKETIKSAMQAQGFMVGQVRKLIKECGGIGEFEALGNLEVLQRMAARLMPGNELQTESGSLSMEEQHEMMQLRGQIQDEMDRLKLAPEVIESIVKQACPDYYAGGGMPLDQVKSLNTLIAIRDEVNKLA